MGFWKDRADEFTGRDKPPAKTVNSGSKNRGSQARGTYYDENGDLHLAPIEELYDEDGRWRGPKGGRR